MNHLETLDRVRSTEWPVSNNGKDRCTTIVLRTEYSVLLEAKRAEMIKDDRPGTQPRQPVKISRRGK